MDAEGPTFFVGSLSMRSAVDIEDMANNPHVVRRGLMGNPRPRRKRRSPRMTFVSAMVEPMHAAFQYLLGKYKDKVDEI